MNRRGFIGGLIALASTCGFRVRAPNSPSVLAWHCKTCGEHGCRNLPECRVAYAEERQRQAEEAFRALSGAKPPCQAGWAATVNIPHDDLEAEPNGTSANYLRANNFYLSEQCDWYHNAYWAQKDRAERAEKLLGIATEPHVCTVEHFSDQ